MMTVNVICMDAEVVLLVLEVNLVEVTGSVPVE